MFDGASGEAMHKELHWIALTATHSSFRYQASTLRLQQNLNLYDLMTDMGMAQKFNHYWHNYKSVLQRKHFVRGVPRDLRLSPVEFWERLYRYGHHSMADWSDLGLYLDTPTERRSATCSTDAAALKKDFVKTTLQARTMFSVLAPKPTVLAIEDGVADDADHVAPALGSDSVLQQPRDGSLDTKLEPPEDRVLTQFPGTIKGGIEAEERNNHVGL